MKNNIILIKNPKVPLDGNLLKNKFKEIKVNPDKFTEKKLSILKEKAKKIKEEFNL